MIYFNQAATTYPKPQCVLEAHTASLYTAPSGQFRSSASKDGEDIFDKCRKKLGKLLGIQEYSRIFFSSGATDSANALIYGLPLEGKHIVVTQTEHNSILRPLLNLKEQVGEVSVVPCDVNGYVRPEDVEAAVTSQTAAVFVNHCSNVTGMIQDIPSIAEITKQKGILLIVDASQSAGCIPIEADQWGIDAMIFTGHKSLFGVQGTGGYFVRRGVPFRPYKYGGTGRDSSQLTYENGDYEYEPGTQNTPGITALEAGVSYILERGVGTIALKEQKMMTEIYEALNKMKGIRVYGNEKINKGPVLSFNIEGLNPSDVAYILQNGYEITVRTGLHCAPLIHEKLRSAPKGTVRVSISDMTKEEEVQILLKAVKEISESAGEI